MPRVTEFINSCLYQVPLQLTFVVKRPIVAKLPLRSAAAAMLDSRGRHPRSTPNSCIHFVIGRRHVMSRDGGIDRVFKVTSRSCELTMCACSCGYGVTVFAIFKKYPSVDKKYTYSIVAHLLVQTANCHQLAIITATAPLSTPNSLLESRSADATRLRCVFTLVDKKILRPTGCQIPPH